jgi:L-alanine-DL-glutamate epimerase-like enolase superfamily enzyme
MATRERSAATVDTVVVHAYTVPTEEPESDGTLEWDSTTLVLVEVSAEGETGVGYTYCDAAAAALVEGRLAEVVRGADGFDPQAAWLAMTAAIRNTGRPGIGFCAVSAVDVALWDLKARLLDVPLASLLGVFHEELPVYGSGGFTSLSGERLGEQLAGWVADGIPRVKMKIGRDPAADPERLRAAREAVGDDAALLVDANGAYSRKEALAWAERLVADWGVTWFEEPVSSADVEALQLLRDRAPGGLDIAAGEYGYVPADFRNLVRAVDCLQADITRCGGITGLLQVGGLAAAFGLDLSAHCAPALSAHVFCALPRVRHLEWFHDHLRVERLLFHGVPEQRDGRVRPDRSRPGLGLELDAAAAAQFRVFP